MLTAPRECARRGSGENLMRSLLVPAVAAALAAALSGCSQQSRQHASDERLAAIYRSEWQWRTDQLPDDEDSTRPVADHLPKVDAATQDMRRKYWEDVLRRVEAIARASLSAKEQGNYDIYRAQIAVLIANQRFRDFEMPANSDTTFWTNIGYTARRPFRTLVDYQHWIAQMHDIPRYFHEQMEEMRAGMRRGFTPPRVTMAGRDTSITAVTDATPAASLFYTPFRDMPGIAAARQASLRADALKTIREVVQPAYVELLQFMRSEYVPGMRTTLAAADLPDGRNYYRAKIREFTTLDLDADAIHQLGVAEVQRLHEAMVAAMRETGFAGDFPAFLRFLRTDPRFYARSPEELLMHAAWAAKRFDGKAAQFFGYLPRARFAIKPVPEDLAPFYTAGRGGMFGYQIWRAARLVVDTGIHAQGWTRERAIEYFRQYTALPEREIDTEVDRYIAWPGQALSYYLGERAFLDGRARAEQALGERFNVRAFHDAVLELGSVPLPVLQARIERFIAEGGRGPYPDME